MCKSLRNGVGIVLVAGVVAACGPKAGLDASKIIGEARQLASAGKVDQAVEGLESFYRSRRYQDVQPVIFKALLEIEVTAGRLEAARKRYVTVAAVSPESAAQVTGIIEEAMRVKGNYQELMDWCGSLTSYKLGDTAFTTLANQHVMALSALGRIQELALTAGRYLPLLSEPAALNLANSYFRFAMQNRQWGQAERLLTLMEQGLPASPELQDLKVTGRIQLLLARDGWRAADAYFREVMKTTPDRGAASSLRLLGEAEMAANEMAAAEALYESGLIDNLNFPLLRETAASGWVNIGGKRGDPAELVRRLKVLPTKNIPKNVIINLISQNYTCLLSKGSRESLGALREFCESLRLSETDVNSLRQLDGMLLDISYFREDYEEALKIIERGWIVQEAAKKEMMINKINAHIALKKDDYRGAIACFRKFMEVIAKDPAYTFDPVEQIRISPAMILGMNARRIGDLWGKAGVPDEAAKAYGEARKYYGDALREFSDSTSGEYKKIIRERDEIPQG